MKLTKKLFIAIMTMALLVVTFSASTFAWFTLGQTAEINNVHVNVTAGKGMEISADAKKWQNVINLTDDLSKDIDFIPLSTYDSNSEGVKLYDENGNQVTFDNNLQNGENYFFEKTFYVRITKDDAEAADFGGVYLTEVVGKHVTLSGTAYSVYEMAFGDEGATRNGADQWVCDATLTSTADSKSYTEGNFYNFDALNAVKISFTANAKQSANVLFGYEGNNSQGLPTTNGTAKLYAESKGYEIKFPVNTPASGETPATYYDTLPTYIKNSDLLDSSNTVDGIKYADGNKVLAATGDDVEFFDKDSIPADLSTDTNLDADKLDDNYLYARITVRIWLEGWDADCINAILAQKTVISFKLKAH